MRGVIWLIIVMLTISVILGGNRVSASQLNPKIFVDPSIIIDPSKVPGSTFTVGINVSSIPSPGLFAYEFYMRWNPSIFLSYPIKPIVNANFTDTSSAKWTTTVLGTSGTYFYGYDIDDGNPSPGSGPASYRHRATTANATTFCTEQDFNFTFGKRPNNVYLSYAYKISGNSFGSGSYLYIRLQKPDLTWAQFRSVAITGNTTWIYVPWERGGEASFAQNGTYKIRLTAVLKTSGPGWVQVNWDDVQWKLVPINIEESTFLKAGGSTYITAKYYEAGCLYVENTLIGRPYASAFPVQGSGTLISVTFYVEQADNTVLDLHNSILLTVGPPLGYPSVPIDHTSEDGYFANTYLESPQVWVDPSARSVSLGQTFDINVRISHVTDLYLWVFSILWNPAKLEFISVKDGEFLKEGGNTTDVLIKEVDQTKGYMSEATCSLLGNVSGVCGNGTLATITFKAKGLGSSPLDIYFSDLLDSQGNSIFHKVTNSSVDMPGLDLSISTFSLPYPDFSLYANVTISMNVTIHSYNRGNARASVFNASLTAYWNEEKIVDCFEKLTIEDIEPNTTRTLQFTITLHYNGNYLLTFEVDCDNTILESDETNNQLSLPIRVKIQGDINGDNQATYKDLFLLAKSYGSDPTKPTWNIYADINGDGRINYKDLYIFATNYGKTYP